MTSNVGNADQIVRIGLAVVAAVIAFIVGVSSVLGIVLLIVAGIALVTALTSFCPLYRVFGVSTCKTRTS